MYCIINITVPSLKVHVSSTRGIPLYIWECIHTQAFLYFQHDNNLKDFCVKASTWSHVPISSFITDLDMYMYMCIHDVPYIEQSQSHAQPLLHTPRERGWAQDYHAHCTWNFMFPVPEASVPAVEICSERSEAGITANTHIHVYEIMTQVSHTGMYLIYLSQRERPCSSPKRWPSNDLQSQDHYSQLQV